MTFRSAGERGRVPAHDPRLGDAGQFATVESEPELRAVASALGQALASSADWCTAESQTVPYKQVADPIPGASLEPVPEEIAAQALAYRAATMAKTAQGECTPDHAALLLEAMRWLERLGYHARRGTYHLSREPHPTDEDDGLAEAAG